MKILFAVNFPRGCYQPGNEIFVHLWERFASRARGKLHCDIAFVSQGWPTSQFQAMAPTTYSHVFCENNSRIWLNYPTLVTVGDGYDFVFRMDEDAFTTVENINLLCDFIRSHPEIDFIGSSNNKRPVICTDSLQLDRLINAPHPLKPNVFSYTPWNNAGYSGDIYGIKRSFFMEALQNYKNDPSCRYQEDLAGYDMPFDRVCDLLNFSKEGLTPQMLKAKIFWDGGLSTDIWTHMCALGMKMAGIVDENGKSFRNKNLLKAVDEALKFASYKEVQDSEDIAWPRNLNVSASHIFHIENGYTINWYFNPMTNSQLNANPATGGIVEMMRSVKPTLFFSWLYAMVEYLTDLTEQKYLIDHLRVNWDNFCNQYQIDKNHLSGLKEKVVSFYSDALVEYLP